MEFSTLIQTLGFPIFVTLWFMFRFETVINKNTEALQQLKETLIEAMKR